ncbi:MAG TPA: Holliday junction resolvase RuvX [Geminicoccaceae bacterium]|nr:Holliday junction resolvase RuvX [Geminicoccus sp.]HMU50613.1 Holliday junction resolvase RuvX [Geminicoccaceae bacterium]
MNGKPVTLFRDAPAFAAALPAFGSLLALDVSPRRIGFAGTDAGRRLVTPLATWARRRLDDDLAEIARLVRARDVVAFVVGWPLELDGRRGPSCDRVRSFVGALLRYIALPLFLQDERLTTAAVEQAIEEGRLSLRPGEPRDHLAAAVILEDALRATGMAASSRPL